MRTLSVKGNNKYRVLATCQQLGYAIFPGGRVSRCLVRSGLTADRQGLYGVGLAFKESFCTLYVHSHRVHEERIMCLRF